MTKKITLLGEEIDVRFNMAVMLAYEEIMGEPFLGSAFDSQKSRYALLYAVIISSKPETKITADALLKEAEWTEIQTALETVTALMAEWFDIPAVVKGEADASDTVADDQTEDSDGEKPKN